jgi:hypothetical protein
MVVRQGVMPPAARCFPGDQLPKNDYTVRARNWLNLNYAYCDPLRTPEQNLLWLRTRIPSDFLMESFPAKISVRVVAPSEFGQYDIQTTGHENALEDALAQAREKIAADKGCPLSASGAHKISAFELCDGSNRVITQDILERMAGHTLVVRPVERV